MKGRKGNKKSMPGSEIGGQGDKAFQKDLKDTSTKTNKGEPITEALERKAGGVAARKNGGRAARKSGGRTGSNLNPLSSAHAGTPAKGRSSKNRYD